jgi:hypothetical protein
MEFRFLNGNLMVSASVRFNFSGDSGADGRGIAGHNLNKYTALRQQEA